ncbi:MAG: dehydrogenase/reductase SDR family protein 7 [Saprospiraceae bacterium]|jgi:dehydrogenase/reductase SDR family protein 7
MTAIKDKVVWITGASSGIGEALSKEYAKLGAKLILSARREAELQRVKKECALQDDRCLVLPLDLGAHDQMEEKVRLALDHFGQIDILINNGGISQRSLVRDTDFSVYKKLIDIDYLGIVALSKAVLPHFIERKSGHFAAVTSLMGKFASPLRSGYCGAKHAVHGFFDALRMEHHDDNIKVTLICPGFIRTNVSMNALTKNGSKQETMDNKTGAGMAPEKCAQKIISGIRRNKMEITVGGIETFAVYFKRFFPSLLHSIARKAAVT